MFSGRTLLFLGLGLFLCLTTLSTTAAGLPRPAVDFPLPVDSYHDQQIPSVFGKLTERIQREPLNLVATIIFFGAIVHTFMAARFRKLAHNYQQSYDAIEHCFIQLTAHRILERNTTSYSSGLTPASGLTVRAIATVPGVPRKK
jgi:hypothetical protein